MKTRTLQAEKSLPNKQFFFFILFCIETHFVMFVLKKYYFTHLLDHLQNELHDLKTCN